MSACSELMRRRRNGLRLVKSILKKKLNIVEVRKEYPDGVGMYVCMTVLRCVVGNNVC